MPISLMRYRRLYSDAPDAPLLTLDDRRLRRLLGEDEQAARLLEKERARLRLLQRHEARARREGYAVVAGVDEVGRGPLAGPLVAAAVVFMRNPHIPVLDDSKKLSPQEREALHDLILSRAAAVGIGTVTVEEINVSNMHRVTLEAMARAVARLSLVPDCVLVDGRHPIPGLTAVQRPLVKGDTLSISIAAASVIAKVTRDRFMDEMDGRYPQYGFRHHKGYGTPEHLAALHRVGPCPLHRARWTPVVSSRVGEDRQLGLFD